VEISFESCGSNSTCQVITSARADRIQHLAVDVALAFGPVEYHSDPGFQSEWNRLVEKILPGHGAVGERLQSFSGRCG